MYLKQPLLQGIRASDERDMVRLVQAVQVAP